MRRNRGRHGNVYVVHDTSDFADIPSYPRMTVLASGGLQPHPNVFAAWAELEPVLESRVDLDALACREEWMVRGRGAFFIDLREYIGERREFQSEDPFARMSREYPAMTEHFVESLLQDARVTPFMAIMCKSGIHRSYSLLLEVSRRWPYEDHVLVVLQLSHIIQCYMCSQERYLIYHTMARLVAFAVGCFGRSRAFYEEDLPRLSWSRPCSLECSYCQYLGPRSLCGKIGAHEVHVCCNCTRCGADCMLCGHRFCNRGSWHTFHRCYTCYLARAAPEVEDTATHAAEQASSACASHCAYCRLDPRFCGKSVAHTVHVCEGCAPHCGMDCSVCSAAYCNRSKRGHRHHICALCDSHRR